MLGTVPICNGFSYLILRVSQWGTTIIYNFVGEENEIEKGHITSYGRQNNGPPENLHVLISGDWEFIILHRKRIV